jgi:histidine triad (HIT) family protein
MLAGTRRPLPDNKTRTMADTIFRKIIDGEIPCHRVYEDEHVLAFLDINPLSSGHTLVVPKEGAETLDRLSDDAAAALGRVLPRICRAVMRVSGSDAFNVLQNNGSGAHQAVLHVHFHVIPKTGPGRGLGIGWPTGVLDPAEGVRTAERLREALERDGQDRG